MKHKLFPFIKHPNGFRLLLALLFVCAVIPGISQTVVVLEDLRQEPDRSFGPGRKHFRHMFAGLHFMAGPAEEGADIIYGRSQVFELGMRYKREFHPLYAAGYDVKLKRISAYPRQQESKQIPGPELYDKEKLIYLAAGLVLYQRFHFGRRGNYMGHFLDTGVYGDWHFHSRHISFYSEEGQKVRTRRTGLDYPSMMGYGLLLRVGFNNTIISGSYRLSDFFDEAAILPEIPRFVLGLEMGLHRR